MVLIFREDFRVEKISFNGWANCRRLRNREMELVVTCDVGPRIIRCGFIGQANMFGEITGQQGSSGESEWMIRGGHRLWIAPEAKPWSYEIDNEPCASVEAVANGLRVEQLPGPLTGLAKSMEIVLQADANRVTIRHRLTNRGGDPVLCAPWALSVMGLGTVAIIPLPAKIPHTQRLTHNQSWQLWAYTDLSDPRWSIGSQYLIFRQDSELGPNKLGMAHHEGWVGAQREGCLFVKRFSRHPDAVYPDGGCNFETFANQEFLELESLAPLVSLAPGDFAEHTETWEMFQDVPECRNDNDVERHVLPLIRQGA